MTNPDKRLASNLADLANAMISLLTRESSATHPQDKDRLRREIDATDRQIDQLVYQLYGLSDDEVKIVEQATA